MEHRHLRYFIALAESLHFGRAADRLHLTQPALSKQIASLEKELGVQLLIRTKRSVTLTPAGQIFLHQAQQLLAQTEMAIQITQRTARGEIGQLSLGFTKTATHTLLPQWIRRFRQGYPEVQISMLELSTEAQVNALNEGRIDLAFLHPPIDERGLQVQPIFEEEFGAILPVDHPLLDHADRGSLPIGALADYPLIIHPRHEGPILYDAFIRTCQQAGFEPQIVQESISLQTRICLVASGLGITFTSASLRSIIGDQVCYLSLQDCPLRLAFAAAWRRHSLNPPLFSFLRSIPQVNQARLDR